MNEAINVVENCLPISHSNCHISFTVMAKHETHLFDHLLSQIALESFLSKVTFSALSNIIHSDFVYASETTFILFFLHGRYRLTHS